MYIWIKIYIFKSQSDIKLVANERLKDAECLLKGKRYGGAYYMAGYVIELLLKAKVCKTIGIDDFYDFDTPNKKKLKLDGNLYRQFKIHNYDQLLILSGIFSQFEAEMNNPVFKSHWSLVSEWNENCRYEKNKNLKDVKKFVTSVKALSKWILKYL